MTGLLLDTHALLWWRGDYGRLSRAAFDAIEDPDRAVFFSAASIWEMAIKHAAGKLRLPADLLTTTQERGFTELPVSAAHALAAGALPRHHSDPFDRMLVAQARSERLTLVSGDTRVAAYDVPVLW